MVLIALYDSGRINAGFAPAVSPVVSMRVVWVVIGRLGRLGDDGIRMRDPRGDISPGIHLLSNQPSMPTRFALTSFFRGFE